jgi:hypothetical protein
MSFSAEVEVNGKTPGHSMPGFDEAEPSWLDDVVEDLNQRMREAASSNDWHYVDGIADGYLRPRVLLGQLWSHVD